LECELRVKLNLIKSITYKNIFIERKTEIYRTMDEIILMIMDELQKESFKKPVTS